MNPRVKAVVPKEDHQLEITFTNGKLVPWKTTPFGSLYHRWQHKT